MTGRGGRPTDAAGGPARHVPVLAGEVVEALAVRAGGQYCDGTFGAGGYARAILDAAPDVRVLALDRDPQAIAGGAPLVAAAGGRLTLVEGRFGDLAEIAESEGFAPLDGVVLDIGVSSMQIDDPARGFSFRQDGPLDMRMEQAGPSAADLVNGLPEAELADVIYQYGEERRSRRIARSVKRALADNQLETTLDLRRAIVRAVGPVRVGGVDPATRTFQALRIAVNRELEELEHLLAALPDIVEPGGVAGILSFHSLEDRLVKRAFHEKTLWAPLTKKPLVATDEEGAANPRSRSAKLRAARRLREGEHAKWGMKRERQGEQGEQGEESEESER
jgi:16S rRNA (cytosine1402-N4)-methyltransferase